MTAGTLTWPANRAAEALEALARRSGLRPKASSAGVQINVPARVDPDPTRLGRWIEASAAALGFDAEPEEIRYIDAERILASAAPACINCSRAYWRIVSSKR